MKWSRRLNSPRLPARDLVLIGAGHTNLHVVRAWRMRPLADVRLTLVSPFSQATYSGMLPGTLAGLYAPGDMQIDLWRMAESCGARLIVAEATGIDPTLRQVLLADRPPIPYDVVSVGIGSIPADRELWSRHPEILSIKPMSTFLSRLDKHLIRQLERRAQEKTTGPFRFVIVGAGAGGTEITCGLDAWLRSSVQDAGNSSPSKRGDSFLPRATPPEFEITLLDSHAEILKGYAPKAVQLMRRELSRRGVNVALNRRAVGFDGGALKLDDGSQLTADLVVWAVGASPPPLLANIPLPKSDDGFLAISETLQSTGDDRVFAVGDSGTLVSNPFPKAGVYAVREGPILWENLRRLLNALSTGRATLENPPGLQKYRPQRGFLSLLSVGDGRAILDYHGFAAAGRWAWWLKDRIDRTFMRMYQTYPVRMSPVAVQVPLEKAMRCAGCGGKVGSEVLATALRRLNVPPDSRTVLALETPDDAVVLDRRKAPVDVLSVDFFESFLDDPYLVGRVAAVHVLSDLYAMGADPVGALAIVTVPAGDAPQQSELLYQILAGAMRELSRAGANLWGGHTTEASELTVGFSVAGELRDQPPLTKSGLREGDRLMLTKSLGTGVLLAAHRLCQCRAPWLDALLQGMLRSNATAARLAREFAVQGATDVTGFGLAGHLLEMLDASGVSARIQLSTLPLVEGFSELVRAGVRSSLDPANRRVESRLKIADGCDSEPAYAALFDPQTSGGLLLGVSPERAEALLAALHAAGEPATIIGEVTSRSAEACEINL